MKGGPKEACQVGIKDNRRVRRVTQVWEGENRTSNIILYSNSNSNTIKYKI